MAFLALVLAAFVSGAGGPGPAPAPQQEDASDDWPRWRGAHFDDTAQANGAFAKPFELRVRWRVALGSGYSGVSVRGSTAVTMAASEGSDYVVALDADSGAERWRHRIGPAFPGQDGASDGPVSTPTLSADTVYALAPRGELLALALADGALRWSTRLEEDHGAAHPHWGFTTAPLVVTGSGGGELVVVAAGAPDGHAFLAFDARDGTLRWHAGTDAVQYASPMLTELGGREVVLGAGNTLLFALDPATGEVLARAPHGGADFYQGIVQPLALGEDAFLLKNQRMTSRCLRLPTEGTHHPEELWSTHFLNQNYNLAVLHDGLVFGHGGSFLACLDASSGELLWRSRPPGDGWIIVVDGHLVVLTKEGGLHVAPASPDGYEEQAALELFEYACWTPPSFARGRVYARDSFRDVACVEIVPRSADATAKSSATPQPLRGVLAELERAVESAADPRAAVDAFLARQKSFPIVEGANLVHFVWRGEAQEVLLRGDMLEEKRVVPLTRLTRTDLFAATLELEPDARCGYQFEHDLGEVEADPLNPRTASSLRLAPLSLLCMPGATPPPEAPPAWPEDATRLATFVLDVPAAQREGQTFGGPRKVWVYLPRDYATSERRYPVLYVNSGEDGRGGLGLPALLDELDAAAGDARRTAIGVFVEQQGAYEFARGQQALYRDLVVERVVPYVDAHWRTRATADGRAVLGWDEGAYAALFAGLTRPTCFGAVGAVSLYHGSAQGERVLAELVRAAPSLPAVVLSFGRYDSRDPTLSIDTPRACRGLAADLTARGGRVTLQESADGDEIELWRTRLPSLLRALLPAE